MSDPLTTEQLVAFEHDGFLVLPDFYDLNTEVEPVQRGIHSLIGMAMKKTF